MALNNKKGVSEDTRKRILKVAEEIGYIPNDTAKSLSTKKSTNIVLYMSALDYEYFHGSFNFDILKYISSELTSYSYRTVVQMSTLDRDAEAIYNLAKSEAIGAFVFMGTRLSAEFIKDLVGDIPCIFFNKPQAYGNKSYSVSFDNRKATCLLTEHVIEMGHKDIAFVGYLPGVVTAENRLLGYKDAHKKYNIEINNERVIHSEHLPRFGYSVVQDMIEKKERLPSSFVCGNDRIAVGVMEVLLEYGFSIPDDVSVCGIDNAQLTDMLKVPLTTVDIHTEKIGAAIAKILIGIFNGNVEKEHIMIDVEIVKRESTGKFNRNRKYVYE